MDRASTYSASSRRRLQRSARILAARQVSHKLQCNDRNEPGNTAELLAFPQPVKSGFTPQCLDLPLKRRQTIVDLRQQLAMRFACRREVAQT